MGDIDGEHAVVLFRAVGEEGDAVVEITARSRPSIPCDRTLAPGGGHSVYVCCLTGFIPTLVKV